MRKEINNKVNKFQRMCGTISKTLKGKTLISTQLKFYKVMAVPVLMYGSKKWSLNRSDKRKIEAALFPFYASCLSLCLISLVTCKTEPIGF